MDDEHDFSTTRNNLIKWPFYVANALILGTVVSYLINRPKGEIGNGEVAICVFAVALSAMLFFVPYLVEYFISISAPEKKDSSNQDGLLEKTYLESKGLKENLSDFGVKLEKIPSIIEGIVNEANLKNDDDESLAKLEKQIDSLRSNLEEILSKLSETPTPQDSGTDPRLDEIISSMKGLEETLKQIGQDIANQPAIDSREPGLVEEEPAESDQEHPEGNLAKVDRILEETKPAEEEEEEEEEEERKDLDEEDEVDEGSDSDDEGDEDEDTSDDEGDEDDSDDEGDEDEDTSDDEDNENDFSPEGNEENVADETTGEDTADSSGVVKGVSQPATVVAKIIIGIGNKVHVRGEGPGLSWDEGVPMSFLEIGKWSWTPSDKSIPLVIQLYKNDEEPDTNGRIELDPGENVEISPKFTA